MLMVVNKTRRRIPSPAAASLLDLVQFLAGAVVPCQAGTDPGHAGMGQSRGSRAGPARLCHLASGAGKHPCLA